MLNLQLSAGELAVHHSPDSQRVGVFQFGRQGGVRKILMADGTGKAKYCLRAHGSCAAVSARGIGSAVNHGVRDFNSGWVSIENDAADLVLQQIDQIGKFPQVFLGAVNRRCEMAAETSSGIEKLSFVGEMDQYARRTKYFGTQIRTSQQAGNVRLECRDPCEESIARSRLFAFSDQSEITTTLSTLDLALV